MGLPFGSAPVVVFPGSGLLLPEQKYGSKEEGGNTATGRQEAFVFLSKVSRAKRVASPSGPHTILSFYEVSS